MRFRSCEVTHRSRKWLEMVGGLAVASESSESWAMMALKNLQKRSPQLRQVIVVRVAMEGLLPILDLPSVVVQEVDQIVRR